MKLPAWLKLLSDFPYFAVVTQSGATIKRSDCLILNVSKSTFDLFLRYLHDRGWGQGDVQQVYDLHARYLR